MIMPSPLIGIDALSPRHSRINPFLPQVRQFNRYWAGETSNQHDISEFDPLASLNLAEWKSLTGDYFVVVDHNYQEDDDLNDGVDFADFDHS